MSGDVKVPKRRFKEFVGDEGWKECKLGEITTYKNGIGHENYVSSHGKYELITLKSINSEGNIISSQKYIDIKTDILKKGTIIMMLSEQAKGMLGMTAVIPCDNKYVLNQRIASLTPVEGYKSSFLTKAINKKQVYFEQMGAGTKVQNISKGNVVNCILYLPDIYEQEKIGGFFKNIDNLIGHNQRKLEKLKALKKAYLTQMFPAKGESKPKLRFAGFNDEWEECKLSDISQIIGGGTPSTSNSEYWDGDINWYSPVEIGDKVYAYESKRKITSLGLEKSSAKILPADRTLLFSSRAGIGAMAILKAPAATNQGFQSIVLNNGYDIYFLYSMGPTIKSYAEKVASGSTFLEISGKQLGNMNILVPSSDEQRKIGELFKSIDNLIALQQQKIEKLQNLKKAYLNEMFI